MNSTKSMIGHLLGGAGAVEAIATIKAVETGWLHPTINLSDPEDGVDPAVVCAGEKQQVRAADWATLCDPFSRWLPAVSPARASPERPALPHASSGGRGRRAVKLVRVRRTQLVRSVQQVQGVRHVLPPSASSADGVRLAACVAWLAAAPSCVREPTV